MLLEDISPLHYKFTVGDFNFKAEDFENHTILFSVKDSGGLELGKFKVSFDSDGGNMSLTNVDSDILDRLRRSGGGDAIMRQIKKAVDSTF